ncbi:MAG: sulfurtransferase [Okeania sp. SIO3B5]|uniref:sulfurtransferase n=1 Tax=Okeania sp. SIO3B5 TaxID=2607811 RepID=UPI001400DD7C|nr:sulfurtransferase [Okeania sp. SIO3B5]NEO56934.1 sulfurtransferase [Okeania sp. SIO3B5]
MTNYAYPEVLIDTQWLAKHLNDSKVRIVEIETSPQSDNNGHIPGAVLWNINDLLLPNLQINLEVNAIEKILSQSGITNETTVVFYGSDSTIGGFIFWLLKLFGHEHIRVLNGGCQKWMSEGRPVTTELSSFTPTEYRAKPIDQNLRVLHGEVQLSIGRPDTVILDVRTIQEYQGEHFLMKPPEASERAGHIPSSIHIEHILTLNEDGTFKSFDELQMLYGSHGITSDREVFPYCAFGGRSGYIWFVLKYLLGYPKVRNYDGSWNEWSRLPNVPIEK